jgi:hypothetical protein
VDSRGENVMEKVHADMLKGRPRYISGTSGELDAVAAAPKNHMVLFENDHVRVVRVIVRLGELENKHTHKWPCIFLINSLAETQYHDEKGEIVPRSGSGQDGMMMWVEPEGIHQVKNIDTRPMDGIRFEMKA